MELPINIKYASLHKIDKYLTRFAERVEFSKTSASRYYHFKNKVLRVSNHIGNNSTGCYHIIVLPNGYLIHHPIDGTINIVNYEQVKEFIRVFSMTSIESVPISYEENGSKTPKSETLSEFLDIPLKSFTPGQLASLSSMLTAIKKKINK